MARVNAAMEHVEPVDAQNAVDIPHSGAMNAAAACARIDSAAQPFADNRPILDLTEYIRHVNVPLLEPLNRPGNHIADFARAMSQRHQAGPQIRPVRQVAGRRRAPHHNFVWARGIIPPKRLAHISGSFENAPRMRNGNKAFDFIKNLIGHHGASLRIPLALPVRRKSLQFFRAQIVWQMFHAAFPPVFGKEGGKASPSS